MPASMFRAAMVFQKAETAEAKKGESLPLPKIDSAAKKIAVGRVNWAK